MPFSVWGGILFLLIGLGSAWVGIYVVQANRSAGYDRDQQLRRRWSPTETRLWLIAWVMGGLGWVCFGVTVFQHSKGQYVSVPASAPLIDHVIWVLALVSILGAFAMLYAWTMVRYVQESRSRREDTGRP